jgi:competence CoiA-like predicted nuclease
MTKVVQRELYCPVCKKTFVQPVYISVTSFLMSEEEKEKMKNGTLFKNFCPVCKKELILPPKEDQK